MLMKVLVLPIVLMVQADLPTSTYDFGDALSTYDYGSLGGDYQPDDDYGSIGGEYEPANDNERKE